MGHDLLPGVVPSRQCNRYIIKELDFTYPATVSWLGVFTTWIVSVVVVFAKYEGNLVGPTLC